MYLTPGAQQRQVSSSSSQRTVVRQTHITSPAQGVTYSVSPMVSPMLVKPTIGTMSLAPIQPLSAPMTLATNQQPNTKATYTSSASLTINGVRCEGHIGLSNDRIIQAKNLFVGVAPFVLSQATLEVTPELTVVARNPDIKYHLDELPNANIQSLTLSELRKLAHIEQNAPIYIGLPGQAAALATESGGALQLHTAHVTPVMPSLMQPLRI
eukprot:Protomagalhaensia_sp_Gyna_25__1901@NODE_2007_length_1350_cov_876_328757_g1654_i0_p1_GENE_NODE_2007_length_1350_cov_876_328757_g1654_i0NODE_2007_length_1350_cov_876_328757_g1654_i0_p1_ORF_typecomplete_len211_score32_47AsmA/PF05170_14/0_081_NODE_2007_length_1350_cov_876_328757_g1654_i0174806